MTQWLASTPHYFPIRFFISYSSFDRTIAEAIQNVLEQAGHPVWRDRPSLMVGDDWRKEVTFAIQSSDEIVVLLTEKSAVSEPVKYELKVAKRNNKRVNLFSAVNPEAYPDLDELISSVNYILIDRDALSPSAIIDKLLPSTCVHPVGMREFEWKASRSIFPRFHDLIRGGLINTPLASHYLSMEPVFSGAPARGNGVLWLNFALCSAAVDAGKVALCQSEKASAKVYHPTVNFFHACILTGRKRPRHLPRPILECCIKLTERAFADRKAPLIALLLCTLQSDGLQTEGPNLSGLFADALDALGAHEWDKSEIRRFLHLVPLTPEMKLPLPFETVCRALKQAMERCHGEEEDRP
jgi:hypothetical protein